jgi:hypothetical protein
MIAELSGHPTGQFLYVAEILKNPFKFHALFSIRALFITCTLHCGIAMIDCAPKTDIIKRLWRGTDAPRSMGALSEIFYSSLTYTIEKGRLRKSDRVGRARAAMRGGTA